MARFSRRSILAGLAALPWAQGAFAQQLPAVHMYKDPSCGCCGGWADHMRRAGFTVTSIDSSDLTAVKTRYKVPENLYSCHTAVIGKFIVEGHVPAAAVKRMLADPSISGISAAGMPVGSPGMEMPGSGMEVYDVTAFGSKGQHLFGRFRGDREV